MRLSVGPDLDRARRDLKYFARLCGHPMTVQQLAAADLRSLVTCVLGPRQGGKSHAVALAVADRVVSRRDQRALLIAATALALDADLLTINVRHFPMLERLRPAY